MVMALILVRSGILSLLLYGPVGLDALTWRYALKAV